MESVRDNDETIVPAGNALGKDFIAALIAIWFMCSRRPARVVTTSVDGSQLQSVLWGEIRRFLQTSVVPLPLKVNHLHIRQIIGGQVDPRSELVGRVVRHGESLLGRHIEKTDERPRTLAIFDECSAIENSTWESADTWAHRKLAIGNCYPCENFFKIGVQSGDVLAPCGTYYYTKVLQIKAEDSPNVKHDSIVIPGLVDRQLYEKRRQTWDPERQAIGLDATFWEGASVKLYSVELLLTPEPTARYGKKTMGVDPAEGGDNTSLCAVDPLGILELRSERTPDTNDIPHMVKDFWTRHKIRPEDTYFDRGGGGKQHADRLRAEGYPVKTVGFGETASDPRILSRGKTVGERLEERETRYVYKNRRAELYGSVREMLEAGFWIPEEDRGPQYRELRRQMSKIPRKLDPEGRLIIPPKDGDSNTLTLKQLIGHSPDELESLALATWGQRAKRTKIKLKAIA